MSNRNLPLLAALALSCFSEVPPDVSGGASTQGQDETTASDESDPSTVSQSSTSMSGTTAMSGSADGTSDPSETNADESGPPPCGALGEVCCTDEGCDEGACLLGRCVTFAGVYLDGELCPACPAVLQATTCGCPAGFDASAALSVLSSGCIKEGPKSGLPWVDESMFACAASSYVPGRSDFGGMYLVADVAGAGCPGMPDCMVGNPFAGNECMCPEGSSAVEVRLFAHCGGEIPDPPPAYRLGVCLGDDAPALTIGGVVYSEGATCLVPHPETGNCDCPPELSRASLRVISSAPPNHHAGDLGFCVRAP